MQKKNKIIAIILGIIVIGASGYGIYALRQALYEPSEAEIEEFLDNSKVYLRGAGDQWVNTSDSPVKIFLMLGQSQMVGFGEYDEYPEDMRQERANVLRLEDEGWVMQKPREKHSGPEISFAHAMVENDPSLTIGIIKVAIGGTGVRSFIPDWTWDGAELTGDGSKGPLYRIIREKIEQAKEICNAEFAGVMWKQGESDMLVIEASQDYLLHLEAMIEEIRIDTGIPSLPFFVGTYANNTMLTTPGYTNRQIIERDYGIDVVQALANSEDVLNHTFVVAHGNLPLVDDNLHFSTAGLVTMGQMFADAYLELTTPI